YHGAGGPPGQNQGKAPGASPAGSHGAPPSSSRPSQAASMGVARVAPERSFPWGVILVLLAIGGGAAWWFRPAHLPQVQLTRAAINAEDADPCTGRSKCLYIVTSIQCPDCREAHKAILKLAAKLK